MVPVYRGWDHATALLNGLGPQPDSLEIVVVDDASADGGAERFAAAHPGVRIVVRAENGGFAAAVNSGVAAAGAEVLVVVNSDLALSSAAVGQLAATALDHPQAILGPRTVRPDGREIHIAHPFPSPFADCRELFAPYRLLRRRAHARGAVNPPAPGPGPGPGPVRCDWVVGSCLAFTRAAWRRAGPLDEHFGMYSEETDWQRRARDRGVHAAYLPDVTVRHDETHGTRRSDPSGDRRFRAVWRSRYRYHRRYGGRRAGASLKGLWLAGFAVSAPVWLLYVLVPGHRTDALAELRRAALLARAAVGGPL